MFNSRCRWIKSLALENFYFYLAGLQFYLRTDHKPLRTISKTKGKKILLIPYQYFPKKLMVIHMTGQREANFFRGFIIIDLLDAVTCFNQNSWKANMSNTYYPLRVELSIIGDIQGSSNSAMKRRLRTKIWLLCWDREAEQYIRTCPDCLVVSIPSKPAPMVPNEPWKWVAPDILASLPRHISS